MRNGDVDNFKNAFLGDEIYVGCAADKIINFFAFYIKIYVNSMNRAISKNVVHHLLFNLSWGGVIFWVMRGNSCWMPRNVAIFETAPEDNFVKET